MIHPTFTPALLTSLVASTLISAAVAQDGNSQKERKDIIATAVAAGSFKTLAAALDAAGLVGALQGKGPFTVFAPTDTAFAKLPKGAVADLLKKKNRSALTDILTYHVVAGSMTAKQVLKQSGLVTLNGQRVSLSADKSSAKIGAAKIIKTDIKCSNGVIHVIDAVITPTTDDVVGVAVHAGSFKTLTAAVKAAGLMETLEGKGPFTVFAPTDAAFAKLPKGTVEQLLKPENKAKLVRILTYHVVPGRKFADSVAASKAMNSVEGSAIHFKLAKGKVKANEANIVTTDINASNGVIHVIDSVIMPPEEKH